FIKLNIFYVALTLQDSEIFKALQKEIETIVTEKLKSGNTFSQTAVNNVIELSDLLICRNFLEDEKRIIVKYPGEIVSLVTGSQKFTGRDAVELEIYRSREAVSFCRLHLSPNRKKNLSLGNIARFPITFNRTFF
ncbi:MAG: hypothetical protein UU81_C0040G0010, partial [Microgenomates group bacterium GW2011_GWC1_41_8]